MVGFAMVFLALVFPWL